MPDLAGMKRRTLDAMEAASAGCDIRDAHHPDAVWMGSHPFNEMPCADAASSVWRRLRMSIPDMERRTSILAAGRSAADARSDPDPAGVVVVAWMGHFQGTFAEPLLGIPATKGAVNLRCCEAHEVADGRIARSCVLFDFLDLMRQAGVWPISPALGAEGMWPGPARPGAFPDEVDANRGRRSLETVLAMHAALGEFDGRDLASMPHEAYWTEDFMWYGPSGIGATRGMAGFRAHHQIPFLTGFPDRRGSGHYMRIGDGDFAVTGGWPSVVATHAGEWLGLPATGRRVGMRVMDFYRLEDGRIAENWVPIDIIHVLLQLGVDVFARVRHLAGHPETALPPRGEAP